MELNKEQKLEVNKLFGDFQLKLKGAELAEEDDDFLLIKKEDVDEDNPKPFSQVTFGINGVEVRSNENVEVTSKVMKDLLKVWGRKENGYIG